MKISFKLLSDSDFTILLSWLNTPHVKKWWDIQVDYTLDLVKEKYGTYINGYKQISGQQKPISAFIIYYDEKPIGYIQYYNAYDFPRDGYDLENFPRSLAAIDIFIGDKACINKGIASVAMPIFLEHHVFTRYDHALADPALNNIAAIKAYSNSGFRIIGSSSKINIFWMLKSKNLSESNENNVLFNQLAMREPLFHHPNKYGATKQDLLNITHEEFWEVGASGNVYTKENVINTLLERYNNPNYIDTWEAREFKLIKISSESYLLTYILIQDEFRVTRRATIWQNIKDKWVILYHQGTVVNEDDRRKIQN